MPRSPLCLAFALATGSLAFAAEPAKQLTVTLTSPTDAKLEWTEPDRAAAGHIVEFINHPTDEWIILGFFPRGKNSFVHPRLAPGTPYSYRVRPFYGPASAPIEVTVAAGLSDKAYADAYALPEDYSWAPPQKIARPGAALLALKSIRDPATAAGASPAQVKADVIKETVSGFRLTWTDRASDEEGFLLERIDSPTDFTVVAVVEPNINSFGWALEPPVRTASFRLRAYYYGKPSNVVSLTTGAEDDELPHGVKRTTAKTAAGKTAAP